MAEEPHPDTPPRPAPPSTPPQPSPPLQLHYAQPEPAFPFWDPRNGAFAIIRRLLFSVGCALLAFGFVSAWAGVMRADAPYTAAWGAGLIALNAPSWRSRR
jgi:hypothetical protein